MDLSFQRSDKQLQEV
ncbi:hypothetical protein LINPERPRIM_LOCUS36248 [Linum perenne]